MGTQSHDKKQNILLEGRVLPTMLKFALPFLLANLLQALYGGADLLIIGHFSNAAGISAVATGSQMMQSIISLITGLTTGGTVLIGQYVGARREEDVRETIGTMFSVFGLVAAGMTVLVTLLSGWLARAMNAPAEAYAQTAEYIFYCGCGIVFIFGYNAVSAMLRGMGDSKSPLWFIAVACVCNIAGDLILVGGLGMGAAGAAIATASSQGLSFLLAVLTLRRRKFVFDFKLRSFAIRREKAARLFRLGLPLSLQEALIGISFLFITAIANRMGVNASAGLGVNEKLISFTMLPASAFSAAVAAIVAQNIGAGKEKRARQCLYTGMGSALIFGVLFFAALELWPEAAVGIFAKDPGVILEGVRYVRTFGVDYVLVCFMFCMNGFFNGCGKTTISMATNLISTFAVRVPASFLLGGLPGATLLQLGLAAPISSVAGILICFFYYRSGKWRPTARQ